MNSSAIPADLRALPQWVVWKWALRVDGDRTQWTKPPFMSNGRHAKADDPSTWMTFALAYEAVQRGRFDGLGFVFSASDEYVGVDLDKCIDDDGALEPWAADIVKHLDSYTEKTPSGKGLHVITRGSLPDGGRKKGLVEMYEVDRYFTFTGDRWPGARSAIESRTPQLAEIHERFIGRATPPPEPAPQPQSEPIDLDDAEIIARAERSKNGAAFAALMRGDTSAQQGDHSASDLAYCSALAFWFGRDAGRIDRVFRRSGLMRPKWDERHFSSGETYGQRTVAVAIAGCRESYEPRALRAESSPTGTACVAPVIDCEANVGTLTFDSPHLNLVEWSTVKIEPIYWLLVDRIPFAEFTIVEGDGGIGKTTAVFDLIARLSRGAAMPDGTSHPAAHAVIVAEEDRRSIIKARLIAARADLANVHLVSSVSADQHFFTLPTDAEALIHTARQFDARIICIDALFNHFDQGINVNVAQDVRKALRPVIEGAHLSGAAIIGIRHWAKTAGAASNRGLGSVDLRNIARSVISVAPHPSEEDRYVAAVSKSNLGARSDAMSYQLISTTVTEDGESVDVARVHWGTDVAITANELAGIILPSAEEGAQIDVAGEFIVDMLGAGPRPSAEIYAAAKDAKIAASTLKRAAKRNGVIMTRAGFPTRSTWTLPESHSGHTQSKPALPDPSEPSGPSGPSGPTTQSNSAHSVHILGNGLSELSEPSDDKGGETSESRFDEDPLAAMVRDRSSVERLL